MTGWLFYVWIASFLAMTTNNIVFVFLTEVRIQSFLRNNEFVYCFVFLCVVVDPEMHHKSISIFIVACSLKIRSVQEDERKDDN